MTKKHNRESITHHVRVLHPVNAVPVSQVGVPLLVIVAGVRGLFWVGGCGGVHWKTEIYSHVTLCDSLVENYNFIVGNHKHESRICFRYISKTWSSKGQFVNSLRGKCKLKSEYVLRTVSHLRTLMKVCKKGCKNFGCIHETTTLIHVLLCSS